MNKNKGFSLIELLVVIAIIGVLATIMMTAISSSSGKSKDSKIKQQMAQLKRTTEVYMSYNNNYGSTTSSCASGMFADTVSDTAKFVTSSNYPGSPTITCQANANAWAVSIPLSDGTNHWCVDSLGSAKSRSSAITGTSC